MLGLDLDQHAIYAVVLKENRVTGYGWCPTPPESLQAGIVTEPLAVANAIQRLMTALKVRETSVHLAVGGPGVISKWVEVPRVSPEELMQSAPFEAPRHLPPAAEPMVYRFWIPPSEGAEGGAKGRGDTENPETMVVRLIAVPERMVASRLEAVSLAGLEPLSVQPESDAVVRVLTRNHSSKSLLWRGKATAIVHLRYPSTEMSIARETHLEFTRNLGIGLGSLLETLSRGVGADLREAEVLLKAGIIDEQGALRFPEELGLPPIPLLQFLHTLTSEMRRLMDFQRSRFPEGSYLGLLDTFVITGEGALLKGLAQYCSHSLGITCVLGNLIGGFEWPSAMVESLEEMNPYVVALGLAMTASPHHLITPDPWSLIPELEGVA